MNYNDFKAAYDIEIKNFSDYCLAFPWADKEAYKGWVSQTYFYVQHSTRLLALSAAHCTLQEEELHKRYIAHLNEEKGHEVMAYNDLKHLGDHISNFQMVPATALFYQNQYSMIGYQGAVAILGYVIALEGMAAMVGRKIYEKAVQAHGAKACMFWKVHSEDDIEHIELALKQIEALSSQDREIVLASMKQSCMMYSEMLKSAAKYECKIPRTTMASLSA
jgi:pyrroloquinoline quinone (PQQ) biosynthesis protein C